jgi:hypothetical protein
VYYDGKEGGSDMTGEEIDALFKLVGGLVERKNGKAES